MRIIRFTDDAGQQRFGKDFDNGQATLLEAGRSHQEGGTGLQSKCHKEGCTWSCLVAGAL